MIAHPHDHSVAASASIALRPVGPALLEMNAKVSTRPLLSVTTPASALVRGQRAGLGAQPAGRALAGGGSRKRLASVPLPPAIGSRSSSCRSVGWSRRPPRPAPTPSSVRAVNRSSTDRPLESSSAAPSVSMCAVPNRLVTASTAPAKLCGRFDGGRHLAGDAIRPSRCRTRSSSPTAAGSAAATARRPAAAAARRAVAMVTVAGSRRAPRPAHGPRPAPASAIACESTVEGWMRPASIIDRLDRGDVAVVDVGRVPARRDRRTAEREVSTCTAVGDHAVASHLFDEVADPRRAPVPGGLPGWRRRQRRVTRRPPARRAPAGSDRRRPPWC